jgi:hypothetical protein
MGGAPHRRRIRRRNRVAITSAAHHQAARRGWVPDNVAEQAKPPGVSQKRAKTPSMDVVPGVIEVTEKRDPRPTQDDVRPSQDAQLITTAHAGESAQHENRQIRSVPGVVIADRLRGLPCGLHRWTWSSDRDGDGLCPPLLRGCHRRHKTDLIIGLVVDTPAQRVGPVSDSPAGFERFGRVRASPRPKQFMIFRRVRRVVRPAASLGRRAKATKGLPQTAGGLK